MNRTARSGHVNLVYVAGRLKDQCDELHKETTVSTEKQERCSAGVATLGAYHYLPVPLLLSAHSDNTLAVFVIADTCFPSYNCFDRGPGTQTKQL